MNSIYNHPENPQCTRAFMLVRNGERDKAVALLERIGYTNAPHQVQMIEGFIEFQAAFNAKSKSRGKRNGRFLATH